MRLVIQRVEKASVFSNQDSKILGKIEKGLFVLVGIKKGDTQFTAKRLADKLVKMRLMSDEKGKINLSLKDVGGKLLVVSQFTLYADTAKGNRPSFFLAEDPRKAKSLYNYFIECIKKQGLEVETGNFGDYMKINTVLDGPVTIILEE